MDLKPPTGLAINEETMYVTEFSGNRISSLDLTQEFPTPQLVVDGLNAPTDLLIPSNNIIWVSNHNGNQVKQIDISENPPLVTNLAIGIDSPTGLFFENEDLYIGSYYNGIIYSYNIDSTPPVCMTQDIEVQLNDSGEAFISVFEVNDGSYDNNLIESLNIDIDSFDETNIGDNTVTLTVVDESGNSSTCTATVTVLEAPVSVIDEQLIEFSLMPNPVDNNFNININAKQHIKAISIVDQLGKVLIKYKIDQFGAFTKTIDISNFSKGIYFVKIQLEKGELIEKIMKL